MGNCINSDLTTALEITDADIHETQFFETLVTETIQHCGTTDLILVFDKGYDDHDRFQFLSDADLNFITPRKKYSLNKARLYPEEDTQEKVGDKQIVDGFIKLNDMNTKLRWIRIHEKDKEEPFELLTNITDCPVELLVMMYGERWPIELLFKDVKQNFGLKQPIGESDQGVLAHIYIVFISYLILQLFRHLLGGKFSKLSMLKFKRALIYSDDFQTIIPEPPPKNSNQKHRESLIDKALFQYEL